MLLVVFLLVPAVLGYDSSFNYGCQSGKCTYQLVVPKEVAQYIDQNLLASEVTQISASLSTLNTTINNFGDADTSDFTNKFNANYTTVNSAAQDLNTNVQSALQNTTSLVTDSATANSTAHLLYDSIACFKNTTAFSYTCFTRPSTVAPPTNAPTSANPATDSVSTVSQGSQGTVGSTLPFTGTTVTGGSTAAPATGGTDQSTTGQASSDSTDASPSTSAGSASSVADGSSTTVVPVSSSVSTPGST